MCTCRRCTSPWACYPAGSQQTIAIARALTFQPKLVIMDEPTAALAVREVESVLNLIAQMKSDGIATILISHRLNDVFAACERIVVLRRGNVIADLKRDQNRHGRGRFLHRRRAWIDRRVLCLVFGLHGLAFTPLWNPAEADVLLASDPGAGGDGDRNAAS